MDPHLPHAASDRGFRHTLTRRLARVPEAPSRARRVARHFLVDLIEGDDLATLLLATSELVTNAVKFGDASPYVWLHLLVSPTELAVTVTNEGSSAGAHEILDTYEQQGPSSGAESDLRDNGRGLAIVRELSDQLAVFSANVTIVRASKRIDA